MADVKAMLEPRKAVLIGSSKIREEVGIASSRLFKNVTYNMKKFFSGETYVLDVDGRIGYDSLDRLPDVPDLAIVMLPPNLSIVQSERCGEAGVKALIIITGGFKDEQRQLLIKIKDKYGISVLGPNTIMGVINTANGLNTTFEKGFMPKAGDVAVISQSGGVGACLLDLAHSYKIGISKFVFMGDKVDVDDVDILQYLKEDERTRVICIYIEGVRDGRKFVEKAKEVVGEKPILALKGGATQESAQRAKSHTASIAGSDEIFSAAFRKAGIIRVEGVEELMDAAMALSKQPPMRGDNVAIVSNVGGPAILAADLVVRNGLKLATLSGRTETAIEGVYRGVDATNPIDVVADARAERYRTVLELVLADQGVDGVLVINMLKSCFFRPKDALVIPEVAAKYRDKSIVDVCVGEGDFKLVRRVLGDTNVPLYGSLERAVKALRALRAYRKILDAIKLKHVV